MHMAMHHGSSPGGAHDHAVLSGGAKVDVLLEHKGRTPSRMAAGLRRGVRDHMISGRLCVNPGAQFFAHF